MSDGGGDGQTSSGGGGHTPILEWVLAAVGVMVAVGIVAYLVFLGLSTGSGPPDLQARAVRTVAQGSSHMVLVEVENVGGGPAAAVVVQGRLFDDGTEVQTSEATIDYVPVNSTTDAAIVFSVPPDQFELQLRVLGYTTP